MKSNRREFLKTTAATGAAVAAADAHAALAGSGAAGVPPRPSIDRSGLRFSVYGLPAGLRAAPRTQLDAIARAAGASPRRLQVRLLNQVPMPWMAEDIALLTRFVPAFDGVPLEGPGLPDAPAATASFERHWTGRRTAVVVGVEPHAMLVHKGKAREAGIAGATLADFAARGVRPRLPISLDFGSGVNGWIHPVFAEFTGWHRGPAPTPASLFLDEPALRGMRHLRRVLLDQVDAPLADSPDGGLSALMDDGRAEVVASYGNPLLLARRLAGERRSLDEFEVVSLQGFMGLQVPSLLRSAAIQLGGRVRREEAAEVVAGLARAAAVEALLGCLPHLAAVPAAVSGEGLPALPSDHAFYARLPHLHVLADARLMTTLALNLRRPAEAGADESLVAHAASQAYYELAGYSSREA